MILVKHSSPGIASRWLHFLRSKIFARSTAGCCSFPCRYNSCMQHCVITKERLCHLSNQRFFLSLPEEGRDPLGLTSPWRTEWSCFCKSSFWVTADLHISESTGWILWVGLFVGYMRSLNLRLGRVAWIQMTLNINSLVSGRLLLVSDAWLSWVVNYTVRVADDEKICLSLLPFDNDLTTFFCSARRHGTYPVNNSRPIAIMVFVQYCL